jgi:hypothetical protein
MQSQQQRYIKAMKKLGYESNNKLRHQLVRSF